MAKEALTEGEYKELLAENGNHGKVLYYDLHVLDTFRTELPVKLPSVLPNAVRPSNRFGLIPASNVSREVIEGIGGVLHRETVRYIKALSKNGQLLWLRRQEGNAEIPLLDIGSHYHVSSLTHGGFGGSLGLPVIGLGNEIDNFDIALERLNRELLCYLGQVKDDGDQRPAWEKRPPTDLGVAMLRSYVFGMRDAGVQFKDESIVSRLDLLLDRLPV